MDSIKKVIAVFDFDNTLTTQDSFFRFILFSTSWFKILGSIILFPTLFLYLVRVISASDTKGKVFSYFFSGISYESFKSIAKEFSLKKVPRIINKEAFERVEWHKAQRHELVIASASVEDWIKPWARQSGFKKVITTIPEVENGKLTGRFLGANCSGEEKARRFMRVFPKREKYFFYFYSDSKKDRPLLNIADVALLNTFKINNLHNNGL